jgi:antibiotic biosynthesis monooxygenase (ABM) superfamily enzyme
LGELQEGMRTVPGYLGVNVVHDRDLHQYTSIVRFDSLASLKAWEASGMHSRWEAGVGPLVEGPADVRRAEGLEFWFRTTHHAAPLAPSRHKMALVLVVIVTVLSYILVPLIGQTMVGAPRVVRALVGSAMQVGLLTYVIMPRVTRLLAKWLYPSAP